MACLTGSCSRLETNSSRRRSRELADPCQPRCLLHPCDDAIVKGKPGAIRKYRGNMRSAHFVAIDVVSKVRFRDKARPPHLRRDFDQWGEDGDCMRRSICGTLKELPGVPVPRLCQSSRSAQQYTTPKLLDKLKTHFLIPLQTFRNMRRMPIQIRVKLAPALRAPW